MPKKENLLKINKDGFYLLSSSPQTKSISEDLDEVKANEYQVETARYIEILCADLVVLSTRADMGFLAYLLDMARIEASDRVENPELQKGAKVA